jgi:hypothetical protein
MKEVEVVQGSGNVLPLGHKSADVEQFKAILAAAPASADALGRGVQAGPSPCGRGHLVAR